MPFCLLKRVSGFLFILLVVFFLGAGMALAQEEAAAPTNAVSQLPLELKLENVAVSGNEIQGEVVAANVSDKTVNNVAYAFFLEAAPQTKKMTIDGKEYDVLGPAEIIAIKKETEYFSLLPQDQYRQSFSLIISPNIPKADYKLAARAIFIDGQTAGISSQDIELEGSGQFLTISHDTCRLFRGDKEYRAQEGPNFFPDEIPTISCEVKNQTSSLIEAVPTFTISELSALVFPQSANLEIQGDKIIFQPNETKTIKLPINFQSEPQVYDAGLQFRDQQNNALSSHTFFRFIIKGEAARILAVTPDNDIYQKGETARIKINYFGSPDMYWRQFAGLELSGTVEPGEPDPYVPDPNKPEEKELFSGTNLKNPNISLKIRDFKGKLCGQESKQLPQVSDSSVQEEIVDVVIGRLCINPSVEVSVDEAGKTLAALTYKTLSSPEKYNALGEPMNKALAVIVIGAFIILLAGIIFASRRKQSLIIAVFLILLGATMIFAAAKETKAVNYTFWQFTDFYWGEEKSYFTNVNFNAYHTYLSPESFIQNTQSSIGLGSYVNVTTIPPNDHHWMNGVCWNTPSTGFDALINFVKQEIYRDGQYIADKDFAVDMLSSWPNYATSYNTNIPVSGLSPGTHEIKSVFRTITYGLVRYFDGISENWLNTPCYTPPSIDVSLAIKQNKNTDCNTNPNTSWAQTPRIESRSYFTVNPPAPPAPSLSFSANPSSINTGQSSTLSWSSQNTTSCSASGSWSGGKATGGSEGVSPSNTSSYTLICSGPGGSTGKSATVTVLNQPPSASIGCTSPSPNCTGFTPLDPVTLLNQSSDPDNNITSCSWLITGPQSQTLNVCSNFTPQSLQPGSYNARLTVNDAYGLSSTANKSFSMKQDVIAKFSCSEDNTTYTENCSSLDPTVNSQFWLKDLSTPSQGATVNSWSWSLTNANPSSSSLQNIITRFIAQGAQTVILRVGDTQGRTDTETKTVNTRTFIPKFKEIAP